MSNESEVKASNEVVKRLRYALRSVTENSHLWNAIKAGADEIERLEANQTQFAQRLADCEISLGTFDPGAASEYWLKYAPGTMHRAGNETPAPPPLNIAGWVQVVYGPYDMHPRRSYVDGPHRPRGDGWKPLYEEPDQPRCLCGCYSGGCGRPEGCMCDKTCPCQAAGGRQETNPRITLMNDGRAMGGSDVCHTCEAHCTVIEDLQAALNFVLRERITLHEGAFFQRAEANAPDPRCGWYSFPSMPDGVSATLHQTRDLLQANGRVSGG